MKQFRKRTIALVLASVVTVVGAFGADNYKNSLMAVEFENSANGAVNMVLQTKTPYAGNLTPVKKDANTYVLMLPEVNSMASTPDLTQAGNIESIDIKTMPYSNYGKGYLKIVVKTNSPNANLLASNKIFIADNKGVTPQIQQREPIPVREAAQSVQKPDDSVETPEKKSPQSYQFVEEPTDNNSNSQETSKTTVEEQEENIAQPLPANLQKEPELGTNEPFEAFMLVMAIFLILVIAAFSYVKAKNKMREIAGESLDIDINDEEDKPKKNNLKKIRKTIKNLDKAYPKPPAKAQDIQTVSISPVVPEQEKEELNIVDLDELFQEHKAQGENKETDEEENEALEDFLSGFSFDDTEEKPEPVPEEPEEHVFDEELLQKALNNENLKFSQEDVERINKLLKMEINDDTMRDIDKFAISCPAKKIPSSKQVLENLVTTYAVTQRVSFTGEDVEALNKLINVEIDSDFVTDLRTNPERIAQMQQEIESHTDTPRKSREMLTLNVKDMLPDLSEALRQQGGRRIESEAKPTTVYASEGYDVNVLSLTDALPDLSVEINNKDAYKNKPSAEWEYADNSYEVETLNIASSLPDLKDVLAHPDKYEEPEPEEVVVDEAALLNNISNVQFKPFYDGTEEFEVINDFNDSDSPSFSEAQEEFNQFDNFEVIEEEVFEDNELEEQDDFKSLYSGEYFDLDKNLDSDKQTSEPSEEAFVPAKLERPKEIKPIKRQRGKLSEELMKKIAASRNRKKAVAEASAEKKEEVKEHKIQKKKDIKCILEGQTYTIVSSANFNDDAGCHLAKNDAGYVVLGFIGDKICKIKEYETLKSEKIQARQSDKLPDGSLRYIIRIGISKFIVDFNGSEINYVMDLC